MIETRRVMEHYEIHVDGKFVQSCDANELRDTIREIENEEFRDGGRI